MENLDIPEINKLFILNKKNHIRSVWKKELVIQEPYFSKFKHSACQIIFQY